MKTINKSKITNFLNFNLKLIVLSSLLLSQLSLSEIFLYQNNPEDIHINIANADVSDTWYNASYSYRKKIALDHTKVPNTDQSNFPVLLQITDSSLKTVANGGKVTSANGYDIVFTLPNGVSKLDHEKESYDGVSGTVFMWVKIPTLSHLTDTVIYMYYGNSGVATTQENKNGVWNDGGSNDYKMVQHLNEAPVNGVTGHMDSTSYGNNGTPYNFNGNNNSSTGGWGKIAAGDNFDGANDYVDLGNNGSLNITGPLTISAWIYPKANPVSAKPFIQRGAAATGGYYVEALSTGALRFVNNANSGGIEQYIDSVTTLGAFSSWYHVTFVQNGTFRGIYINGTLNASDNNGSNPSSYAGSASIDQSIGGFNTYIDEVHISSVARSGDWVKTEYNNQFSPKEFYKIEMEEVASSTPLSSWQYRKAITINPSIDKVSGNSDLVNFPVLINLASDSELAAHAQNTGNDILFTLSGVAWSAGTQNDKLSHEIEGTYNFTTGSLQAWVNIPSLSPTVPTVIYMYYGNGSVSNQENKTAVWDSNFHIVQHLNQNPSGSSPQMLDSTQYVNNGSASGMVSGESVAGVVGNALSFDGSDDYVSNGGDYSLNFTSQITMDAWVNTSPGSTQYSMILGRTNSNTQAWDFRVVSAAPNTNITTIAFRVNGNGGGSPFSLNLNNGTWYHLVTTYNGSQILVYQNGNLVNTRAYTGAIVPPSSSLTLGRESCSTARSAAIIDEVRVSGIARSSDWIKTEYNNEFSPSSFFSLSNEQSFMNHFIITGSTTQTAGSAQEITLTAIDTFSNTNTTYTGDKTITLSGANPIDSNTPTFTDKDSHEVNFGSSGTITFTNGIAHTTIKLYKAENAEVEASDGTYSTTGNVAYDLNVAVSLLAVNNFDITSPSDITSETSFPLTLVAKDTYDNITTEVTNPTTLSVSDGVINTTSILATDFQDDGTYSGTITISGIYQDKNITLTIRNGSITQTINLAVTGVSHPVGFISPLKPDLTGIRAFLLSGNLEANTIPPDIAQIAISSTPDFKDISWINFDKDKFIKIRETEGTLYLKFRTTQGAVSDTVTYTNNSNPNPTTLEEGDIVKTLNNPDVYVIKYKNNKQYKRLILSPNVFQSYRHLNWNNLKTISQEELNRYTTSSLVKETTDTIIYELFPNIDMGERKTFNTGKPYDVDSVYEINAVDRDSYVLVR